MTFVYDLFEQWGLHSLTFQSIALRLLMATVYGGVLGLERSKKRRAAGFRTYILVCASASLVMMTGQFMVTTIGGTDPARLGAQVISGIGFLGAGTIIVTGTRQIKGLTTAAGLWSAACMGIAIGIGFYAGATAMCGLMLLVMSVFNTIEVSYIARSKDMHLYVVFESINNIGDFIAVTEQQDISVVNYDTTRSEYGTGIGVFFALHFKEWLSHREVIEKVRHCPGLIFLEER